MCKLLKAAITVAINLVAITAAYKLGEKNGYNDGWNDGAAVEACADIPDFDEIYS